MAFLDLFRPTPRGDQHPMLELLEETVRDLSLRVEDRGWSRIGGEDREMTLEALITSARDGRALATAHPLVRRGLALRAAYIHGGGGPQIAVEHPNADVAALITHWWELRENQRVLTGPEARARLEKSLSTDGNVFIAAFTNPLTGAVRCRTLPFEEITRIITDPEDAATVRYFLREHTGPDGGLVRTLYPDLVYAPRTKPRAIDGVRVEWDAPVRHVKVNDLDGWLYGVGDTYAVAPWARGYRDFLADWARMMRSLSQFTWRATTDGKRAEKTRQALARIPTPTPDGGSAAGATYMSGLGQTLEAIPKNGATIDADSGRPLLAMIAAGLDIPVTMLSTDPGITGARSTAETLDEPMYRAMLARRDIWTSVYVDIAEYAIEQSVRAKAGRLQGVLVADEWMDSDHAELDGDRPIVTVAWPDLSTDSTQELVAAIATADATQKLPPTVIARLLLVALGVDDIDTVMEELTDDTGQWRDPYANIGATLTDAFRDGRDPAVALGQYRRFGTPTESDRAAVTG